MKDWRLQAEMTGLVVMEDSRQIIYLVPSDKKTYSTSLKNNLNITGKLINIAESNIDVVKVSKNESSQFGMDVLIKSSNFPHPSEWYVLGNFDKNTLVDLLTQVKFELGEFNGEFEIAFNSRNPLSVTLVSNQMSIYSDCVKEMSRRHLCETGRKTTKWKVGHKYETDECSYVYLGNFLSRKVNSTNSSFLGDTVMENAHLFITSELKDNEKSISDVLNNRGFNCIDQDGIKIYYNNKLASAIDGGEVLKDDFTGDIQDYWPNLFENTKKSLMAKSKFGREYYTNIRDILDIFSIQSNGKVEYKIDNIKDSLSEVLFSWGWECLINYYGKSSMGSQLNVNTGNDMDTNIRNLSNLMKFKVRDENVKSKIYYDNLFDMMDFDLAPVCRKVLTSWNSELFSKDFNFYLKNFEHVFNESVLGQRIFQRKDMKQINKVSDVFGNSELGEAVKNLTNYAIQNYGRGVKELKTFNVGSIKYPKSYSVITFDLAHLLDYINSEMKLTDSLKNEIITQQFTSVIIEFDEGVEVI